MTETPTPYDEIQDARIDELESLVTAEYRPPEGTEYSYPIANQGITLEQYNNMMLPMGDGIIHRGVRPYYLEGHSSDSETNQRNTLILKVDESDEYSGSSIAGFYHRLTEDMELPFPPVTKTTEYYVTVTFDPRRFRTDPLRIEVWEGEPPRSYGQKHIVLNVVTRQANQLLSQATITRYRQFVSPTIAVQNAGQLPAPEDVLFGTTAFAGKAGADTFDLYRNTTGGWKNMLVSEWVNVFQGNRNGWRPATGTHAARARMTPLGVQLKGHFDRNDATSSTFGRITDQNFIPNRALRIPMGTSGSIVSTLRITTDGDMEIQGGFTGSYVTVDGVIYPID